MSNVEIVREKIQIENKIIRNSIAELIGTFILLFIGTSVIAQMVLSREKVNTWVQVNIGWAFALTFAVYPVFYLSGGHLNPAMTLLIYSMGDLDVVLIPVYFVAQTIGAFLGAATTYVVYLDAITAFDGGVRQVSGPNATANIFASYPSPHVSVYGAFFDQVVATGFLAFCVMAVADKRNKIPPSAQPLLFGLSLLLIGCTFALNLGYPLNPARDFGPRIFTLIIYGTEVFTYPYVYWFVIPIFGPIVGALVGGWFYHVLLGVHIPDTEQPQQALPAAPLPGSPPPLPPAGNVAPATPTV